MSLGNRHFVRECCLDNLVEYHLESVNIVKHVNYSAKPARVTIMSVLRRNVCIFICQDFQ